MKLIPYVKEKHDAYFSDTKNYIGYVRGDIDKDNRMWTKFFLMNPNHQYGLNRDALTKFMDWFVELKCMDSVKALYEYCCGFPKARRDGDDGKSFLFFAEDNYNVYKISILCMEKNYNFYVYAYEKDR